MFSDPERRHETEITIRGLKQVFIFYSVYTYSQYRFKILGPDHTKASIAVLASAKGDLKLFQEIGTRDDVELGEYVNDL